MKDNENYKNSLFSLKRENFSNSILKKDLYGNYLENIFNSLDKLDSKLDSHINNIKKLKEIWGTLSHRNDFPDLRLLLNASIDKKGSLIFSWIPYFLNQSDIDTCNTLITHNFGRSGNQLKIEAIRPFSELIYKIQDSKDNSKNDDFINGRNLLWSISILQKIMCNCFNDYVDVEIGNKIIFNYKGKIDIQDKQRENYSRFLDWSNKFENNFSLQLSNFIYLYESLENNQKIRDFIRVNCIREMSYAEVSHNVKTLNDIKDYNSSIWRRSQKINLPDPVKPEKQIPENKTLIQKQGKKARISPVALRGNEGSNLVELEYLKIAIEHKIQEEPKDWHFTAGDFCEFVLPGQREKIVSILSKLKKSGKITSVYKGIYVHNKIYRDPINALYSYILDRGELIVSSGERALAQIGIKGNPIDPPLTFFTNGSLRKFSCLDTEIKISQEPFPDFCKIASSCQNINSFIATVDVLQNNTISIDLLKKHLERIDSIYEFELAQKYLGRFL
jgi:hypothetical protein